MENFHRVDGVNGFFLPFGFHTRIAAASTKLLGWGRMKLIGTGGRHIRKLGLLAGITVMQFRELELSVPNSAIP
jgi:hypothetical protein